MARGISLLSRSMVAATAGLVSLTAQGAQVPPKDSFILERGRAGQFEIGMTVDELTKIAGRDHVRAVTSHRQAESRPALEIRIPGLAVDCPLTIPLERICGPLAAWTIEVSDPRFRTRNGLGVGSTLGDIRRRYPGANLVGIDTDMGAHVAINDLGLWFGFSPAQAFTDGSRVTWVSVGPQIEAVWARRCPDRPR